MYLISKEKLPEVRRMLDDARLKYDSNLEYGAVRLRETLIESGMARVTSKDSLVKGRSYGCIEYHPGATAIRKNRQIPYHGEIYLCKWYWDGSQFYTINAWGVQSFRLMLGHPVIELD